MSDEDVLNKDGNVQLTSVGAGCFDLRLGQPDPRLLPVDAMAAASQRLFTHAGGEQPTLGAQALCYGASDGPRYLTAWIESFVGQTEPEAQLQRGETVVTAGNSDAAEQVCLHFADRGDSILVESPTYVLIAKVFADRGLTAVPVSLDADGPLLDSIEPIYRSVLATTGRPPRFFYTIPTFHNPTGYLLCRERRVQLIDVAVRLGLLLVEDDVYRELYYDDRPPPPSLFALAPRGAVLRLCSFAKMLAPGLRLGWINGSREHCHRFATSGMRDSGGGVNHMTAMIAASFCRSGAFEPHVRRLRAAYQARRDALAAALAEHAPALSFRAPGGGFFIWARLPAGVTSAALASRAAELGLYFLQGSACCIDRSTGQSYVRLAFSMYDCDELLAAAKILGRAVTDVQPVD